MLPQRELQLSCTRFDSCRPLPTILGSKEKKQNRTEKQITESGIKGLSSSTTIIRVVALSKKKNHRSKLQICKSIHQTVNRIIHLELCIYKKSSWKE
jgi:hypothetical protein